MNRFSVVLFVLVGICGVIVPSYGTPMLYYEGQEAGGVSKLDYAYRVAVINEEFGLTKIMQVRIGSPQLDLKRMNYTDVVIPDGWYFGVGENTKLYDVNMRPYVTGPTPVGKRATPSYAIDSTRCLLWWTDNATYAISSFTFGFNHVGTACDAGWRMRDTRPQDYMETNDYSIVGLGDGPVHAPTSLPEPCTAGLLALALLWWRGNRR